MTAATSNPVSFRKPAPGYENATAPNTAAANGLSNIIRQKMEKLLSVGLSKKKQQERRALDDIDVGKALNEWEMLVTSDGSFVPPLVKPAPWKRRRANSHNSYLTFEPAPVETLASRQVRPLENSYPSGTDGLEMWAKAVQGLPEMADSEHTGSQRPATAKSNRQQLTKLILEKVLKIRKERDVPPAPPQQPTLPSSSLQRSDHISSIHHPFPNNNHHHHHKRIHPIPHVSSAPPASSVISEVPSSTPTTASKDVFPNVLVPPATVQDIPSVLPAVRISPDDLRRVGPYILGKTIGSGAFSKVKIAHHDETGEKVAVKMIPKKTFNCSGKLKASVIREIEVMKDMNHKYCVSYRDVYDTPTHLCIVTEFVDGGELFDYIEKTERLSEDEAKRIFKQIVEALSYLHSRGIAHRDLKLENILLDKKRNVKLVDFGMARFFEKDQLLTTRCGSEEYAAPEIVRAQPYDGRKSDVWAVGVILFTMLSGYLPFNVDENRPRAMFHKICRAEFSFPSNIGIREETKDFVKWILSPNPDSRPLAQEILGHKWMNAVEE